MGDAVTFCLFFRGDSNSSTLLGGGEYGLLLLTGEVSTAAGDGVVGAATDLDIAALLPPPPPPPCSEADGPPKKSSAIFASVAFDDPHPMIDRIL